MIMYHSTLSYIHSTHCPSHLYLAGRDPLAHVLPVGVVVFFVGVVQQPLSKVLPPHGVHALGELQELHLLHLGLQVLHEPVGRWRRNETRKHGDPLTIQNHKRSIGGGAETEVKWKHSLVFTCGTPCTAACSSRAVRRRRPAGWCSLPPQLLVSARSSRLNGQILSLPPGFSDLPLEVTFSTP